MIYEQKPLLLSIIVPVYNVEKYLQRCLGSVIPQLTQQCEVIIIDDGSTDQSSQLCDEYGYSEQVRVFHKQNGGLSSARNKGIQEARGKYLLFLDSDDYIEKNSIEKILELIKCENSDIFVICSWIVDDNGMKKEKIKYDFPVGKYNRDEYIKKFMRKENDILFCAPFYICKKEIVDEKSLSFVEGLLHEDEVWTPNLILNSDYIYFTGIFLYYHYIRSNSITHSEENNEKKHDSLVKICEIQSEIYNQYRKEIMKPFRNRLAMLYLRSVLLVTSEEIKKMNRIFPICNAFTLREKVKAIFFLISPKLYKKCTDRCR